MAREVSRLNARSAASLKTPGRHADGNGLYLSISENGGRRWVFLYRRQGRLREMGLGSARDVPLSEARVRAGDARQLLSQGIDPLTARRKPTDTMTFAACAQAYIEGNQTGWKNPKHRAQWVNTLKTYVEPVIGSTSVRDVDVASVLKIIQPIWATKTETASRIRGRIETILDWATAHGYRSGENPARWRGYLDKILPSRRKTTRVQHHAALPYDEIPEFMAKLKEREGVSARALEFTILTAARTGETVGATPNEFDAVNKLWSIQGERMKAGRQHRVPLSERTLAIVENMPSDGPYMFPGGRPRAPLSENAMLATLQRMGRDDLTVHGFRSTFRDWAAECTNFPSEVVEMALAHTISDQTEAAYRRGDLMAKRRALMEAWAAYCTRENGSNVVPLARDPVATQDAG